MNLSNPEIIALRWVSVTVGGDYPIFYESEMRRMRRLEKKGLVNITRDNHGLKRCNLTDEGKKYLERLNRE